MELSIWILLILLVIGFVALVWSADIFVEAAAALARNLGVSQLLIGLTAVSVGTSAPEILVAMMDSYTESPEIAIGNAIGSNIANMGLVLGITALVIPLPYGRGILREEYPMLIAATLLGTFCLANLYLGRIDGILFLSLLCFILFRMVQNSRTTDRLPNEIEHQLQGIPNLGTKNATFRLIVGLLILLVAARVIVWSAESIAFQLNVNEMIIGLTIVAGGTSLPELAVTLRAALRGGHAIAIGNIIGSNLLNLLAVLAVPALLHPTAIAPIEFGRDFGVMFALTGILGLLLYLGKKNTISRVQGGFLLLIYIGYICLLLTQSV